MTYKIKVDLSEALTGTRKRSTSAIFPVFCEIMIDIIPFRFETFELKPAEFFKQ